MREDPILACSHVGRGCWRNPIALLLDDITAGLKVKQGQMEVLGAHHADCSHEDLSRHHRFMREALLMVMKMEVWLNWQSADLLRQNGPLPVMKHQ